MSKYINTETYTLSYFPSFLHKVYAVYTRIEAAAPPRCLGNLACIHTGHAGEGLNQGLSLLAKCSVIPPEPEGMVGLEGAAPRCAPTHLPASAGRLLGDHFSPPPGSEEALALLTPQGSATDYAAA